MTSLNSTAYGTVGTGTVMFYFYFVLIIIEYGVVSPITLHYNSVHLNIKSTKNLKAADLSGKRFSHAK